MNAINRLVVLTLAICLAHLQDTTLGEVVDLEGTVKTVNQADRTLTIVRKTPSGEKVLELEVAKKAGDIDALKAGDRVSFSYDPDLELVTKIGDTAEAKDATVAICRITLHISDTGQCSIELERPKDLNGSGVPNRREKSDSRKREHVFAKPRDLEFFTGVTSQPTNVSLDRENNLLSLKPDKAPNKDFDMANLPYPYRVRVPLSISCDVSTSSPDFQVQIAPIPASSDALQPVVNIWSADGFKEAAKIKVILLKRDEKGNKSEGDVYADETVPLKKKWTKAFRLPIPNVKNADLYIPQIGALGKASVELHRLVIAGTILPYIGLGLDERGGVVFAKSILPNSAAAEAAIEPGDVIVKIGDGTPTSAMHAVELLSKCGFGDECRITIKRGDNQKSLTLSPRWPEE